MSDSILVHSLFNIIDQEKDGKIDFKEYINGMIILTKGTKRQQAECIIF